MRVAPFTGAWIEMQAGPAKRSVDPSLPSRERGLKSSRGPSFGYLSSVAPFTGAWIEIAKGSEAEANHRGRSLHGSVD